MNVVDSSGWLEYFTDGVNADFFAPVIENKDRLLVPVITLYEVFNFVAIPEKKKKKKKRMFGSAKGLIKMAPDFDEPLEDFKEYM